MADVHRLPNYSVYQSPKVNGSKSLTLVLEGNKIDELGYQIYKSYTVDLDKIDILIRNNQTGEIVKIVKDGESESMIGVTWLHYKSQALLLMGSKKEFCWRRRI